MSIDKYIASKYIASSLTQFFGPVNLTSWCFNGILFQMMFFLMYYNPVNCHDGKWHGFADLMKISSILDFLPAGLISRTVSCLFLCPLLNQIHLWQGIDHLFGLAYWFQIRRRCWNGQASGGHDLSADHLAGITVLTQFRHKDGAQ